MNRWRFNRFDGLLLGRNDRHPTQVNYLVELCPRPGAVMNRCPDFQLVPQLEDEDLQKKGDILKTRLK